MNFAKNIYSKDNSLEGRKKRAKSKKYSNVVQFFLFAVISSSEMGSSFPQRPKVINPHTNSHNIFIVQKMMKSFLFLILIAALAQGQTITPYYLLPVQTTQNVVTSYSFNFYTDTEITSNAWVAVTFPFQFPPNTLNQATRIRYSTNDGQLKKTNWNINLYTFKIQIDKISIGNITVVVEGIRNPADYTTSSFFTVQTLFKNVVVTTNQQFGRVPFTSAPVATIGTANMVKNYVNTYIEQGSSWTFNFTLTGSYPANSSIRFVFPENYYSNKIQCNVSGIIDPDMETRVFPAQNVYDCLNLKQPLSGALLVILSGVVNPNFQTTSTGFQVHILQPNNMIVNEVITSSSSVLIQNKPLNLTLTIPNNYRNTSSTYIFQINPDTTLATGDYMVFSFNGLWNFYTDTINVISGLVSDNSFTARWKSVVDTANSKTTITLSNFSSIPRTTQFTFYLPLKTPLIGSNYAYTVKSYRANGGLAQSYANNTLINATTGYIREMKLHPMQRAIKLPVGQTGPLEIVLFLQNNLPQTNVLTYGKIVMDIKPNIPAPIVNLNGVPKCYFYRNIPAANCTFDSASDPLKTTVTIFTPVNFNFRESEVPLTITTEGYQQPFNQGITIDTLVKRYFFEIQFYTHLRPPPIPQQVIFDEWIPDSIPITSASCTSASYNQDDYDHIKCQFTTPNQVLNSDGHIHFFRLEFYSDYYPYYAWYPADNNIIPDYPCLMYGTNVSADPYVKCDYVTWQTGPYKSSQSSTSYNYITFYGLSTIPGGSVINFQIPKIQRRWNGYYTTFKFSILEDTPGFSSPIVYIYTQNIGSGTNYGSSGSYYQQAPSITLTNSVINKVTNITLNSYNIGTSGATHIVLQVESTAFPNIGRGSNIVCGSHTCSKFDKPIQYFILYPSSALSSSATLTFPSIATPAYADNFVFNLRLYKGQNNIKRVWFYVTITPDTIVDRSYKFSPLETITTLYPNSDHFYVVSWTTFNPIASVSGASKISITINNVFAFSSTYCNVATTAAAYDGRQIMCELSAGGSVVSLKNLADVPAGATFNLTIQLRSTSTTSTVSPTLDIKTYHGNGKLVDQALNVPFATTPLTNTNLTVFNSFTVPSSFTSTRGITAGYFGNLLVSFRPRISTTVNDGSKMVLSMPTGFTPSVNSLGLPLSCRLNNIRYTCTYSINPFVITMTGTNNGFTTGTNVINITTLYQTSNGVYFPASSGRYLLTLQIINNTSSVSLQKTQQYIDILPPDINYFNVTWAHRDINQYNIFTVQFKNGPNAIPAYNDATTAGRIYIGFPTVDENSGTVFASDLGFTGIKQGNILPCYFETGANYVTAIPTKSLTCKIRMSRMTSLYYTWIEITNFDSIPASAVLRVIIGKVRNPASNQIDINFLLKVNTLTVATNIETKFYQTSYNMFIDMRAASITSRSELNSSTLMFQPGSTIGDTDKYMNITPYSASSFSQNDWFIMDLDPQFPLNGNIYNCQSPFYQYCIIYPTINWLAIKIGNGTIISLQPFISKLPISLSRSDTTYQCYTFKSGRWSETITYTVAALVRWLQLRGSITNFGFSVLGSQNKLNVGQKNVEVMVSFTVTHMVPVGGTIQIQFPSNINTVPAIKPHCRSAVTMGSALVGFKTGKPTTNMQGEIGCLVQTVSSTYSSWIITGFDELPANSQVKIVGQIDFPTIVTNTLGMGYVVTYSTQHSTNVFTNGKTIDYLSTNFPLAVQNLTWNVETTMSMLQTKALRINYVGELKFLLNLGTTLSNWNGGGYVRVNTWQRSITDALSGFYDSGQPTPACTIYNVATKYKYGCEIYIYQTAVGSSDYVGYHITTFQDLPANTNYQFTITTQKGSATEGIYFPPTVGTFKIEIQVEYYSSSPYNKNQAYYIDVYGPDFSTLFFNSTISIPGENNFIMVIFTPPSTINTDHQLVIEIPTVSVDNEPLFPVDLGMGYKNYDNLIFDLFESSISSMTCKVYTGQVYSSQPVKIICSNFNIAISSAMTVKMGFWVVNPSTTKGLAIPVQVYILDQPSQTKIIWSMVQAGIRLLPTSVTPTVDDGNFFLSSTARQAIGINLEFTARNSRALVKDDWYIMKFNFDLRNNVNTNSAFAYNTNMAGIGDVIFMRKCQTILLRIGATALSIVSSGSTSRNGRISSLIYNPSYQLSTLQATIIAYAIYNSADASERVFYSDRYPTIYPMQPSSPTFTISSVYGTMQMGQPDDWRFTFKMSSATGNSTSLVKLISIQFPAETVYDITMQGKQCYQYSTSTIEVSSCVIDINSRVIWITPFVKASNANDHTVVIESAGYAFISPVVSTSIDHNSFVIRYYTWPDGQSQPNIVAGSDDWCFMKQDSTNIGSSAINFNSLSGTYYSPHSSVDIAKQVIVGEWEPADYMIGNASTTLLAKSPFRFKFIAPTTFSALSGGQYHTISLTFNSYYSTPTLNQQDKDLYIYVPSCELNGFRIHSCSISSGAISMSFQQTLANGQEVSVKFSVINPRDHGDEGFTLTTTSYGTITLPVTISQYSGTVYYFEAEPFHPFYRATSAGATYPSMGISNVALTWGTQAHGQLNYLDFVITFTRNDINGLVLEIPVVSEDGTKIYNNPTLMGIQSGGKYPCSVGVYSAIYCFYVQGSATNYGSPTRIFASGFTIPGNNSLSLRMLFTNPDIPEVFPKFTFRAFGGSYSPPDLMGSELRGLYELVEPFKVYSSNVNSYYRTGNLWCYPNKALWQVQTNYLCYTNQEHLTTNSYVILKWPLVDPSKGTIGDYDSSAGLHYDHFIVNEGINSAFIYLVIKYTGGWTATSDGSGNPTSYHTFGYIRMKHHIINNYKMFVMNRDYTKLYTAIVDSPWMWTYRANGAVGTFGVDVIDAQSRKCDDWSWHYFSLNTASAYNYGFNGRERSQLVVEITWVEGATFKALHSSYPVCNIDSGVIGFDALNPVTCTVNVGASKIEIRNIYAITNDKLRIHYFAQMACSQANFDVTVKVFANEQAYADYNWPLYASTTNSNWNLNIMYHSAYYNWPGVQWNGGNDRGFYTIQPSGQYNVSAVKMFDSTTLMDGGGYTQLLAVSTTSVTVRIVIGNNNWDFSDATYRIGFRFYSERLTYSGPCSIASVYSQQHGWNGWCQQGSCSNTCQVGDRKFWIGFSLYRNDYYQRQWPYWSAGYYYDFVVNFASVGQDSNNFANQVFMQASVLWQYSRYHTNDNGRCGCRYARCSTYCGDDICTWDWRSYCQCCSSGCCPSYGGSWQCYVGNDCRWIYGWDYRAVTNNGQHSWSQSPNKVSQFESVGLVSNQELVETEFSFYLQNIYGALTSTMTSTTGGSAQLIVSFTGTNNVLFSYTKSSEESAYIQCLCVVSNSGISISAGTDYNSASPANCTRYSMSGFPPFLTVRVNANAGQYLACYFPGFRNPSSGTLYANFYRDTANHFKYHGLPEQFRSSYQTTGVAMGIGSNGYNGLSAISYNGYFWNTTHQVGDSNYYELYIRATGTYSNPIVYISSYSPQFEQTLCNSGSFYICRAYNSFFSKRYFLVAQIVGSTNAVTFAGTLSYPESYEYDSGKFTIYVGWTYGGFSSYRDIWTGTLTQSYLTPDSVSNGISPAIYSTFLRYGKPLISLAVQLNGYTLFSNQRTKGPNFGSFIQLVLSGFTSIYGCGVSIKNRLNPQWNNNALYCIISSATNQIRIYSNADWTFSDYMYVTFFTDYLPTSPSYTFNLFDKYYSSSDYGISVQVTGSFGRSVSGSWSTMAPTSIKWRRQAYKQLRNDAGPLRFTLNNNNYQYVSTYDMGSNIESTSSDAITFYVPGSGITNDPYYCFAREYQIGKYAIYKEYVVNCKYYSTTQVLIKSIPSHIYNPNYYYEFIIYKNLASSMLITIPSASKYIAQVITRNAYSGGSVQFLDYIPVLNYLNVNPIALNRIYILTREAAAINSLLVDFTINFAQSGATIFYLEFQFSKYDLNYFNIQNGGNIPCYLSGFGSYSGKANGPRCFGYAKGTNSTSPLFIRVLNFNGFSSGVNYKVAFDNFNNPPITTLYLVPIDLRLSLVDRSNTRLYTSFFPNIYYSDSINIVIPSNLGGSIAMTNSARGVANYHYLNLNWPYNSNNADSSQKFVFKIEGGITSCNAFSGLSITDSQGGYTLIWSNTGTNTSVYEIPSKGIVNTNITINTPTNPQLVHYWTYTKVSTVTFIMYSGYQTSYISKLNQPAFSSYGINSDFVISTPTLTQDTANFNFHSYFPMTYEIYWNLAANSYANRNISYAIIYFTSGVRWIDAAWIRYAISPSYVNKVGNAKVGYDSSNSQWYVNVTGIMDSLTSATYNWYVRVRLYANGNGNYFYYTTSIYNFNGMLEFTATSSNKYLPNDAWSSSSNYGTPTNWNLQFQRYTKNYFQLMRNDIYAATGQTTNKLYFKFTTPYNLTEVESISFISSASIPAPANPTWGLHCIIQPRYVIISVFGKGLSAPCSYNAASKTYSVGIPIGGLTIGEYLLTIIERRQLTTSFNMPTTPQRLQISLIYNSMLNIQYGDVYTLDFPGMMTSYSVNHVGLMTGQHSMIGFTFTPSFTLPAALTSSPVSESVISFEFESNYYDSCLGLANVYAADSMSFYSGVYFTHFSNPAYTNANTRILCGQNTLAQNYAPIKLTTTDYTALAAASSYYFRFPLITMPSANNSPLTYKVKLLQYANGNHYPTIMSQFSYENIEQSSSTVNIYNEWAYVTGSNDNVQKTTTLTFNYHSSYFNIYWTGYQTVVKFQNDYIPAFTSVTALASLSNSYYNYQYYPNVNLCIYIKNTDNNYYSFTLGAHPTSIDQQSYKISYVYTYTSDNDIHRGWFNSGVVYALNTISYASSWTTTSFTKGSNILTSSSMDLYTVSWSVNYLTFPEGSYMILSFSSDFVIVDEYCYSYSGFIAGVDSNSNIVCKRYSSTQIIVSGFGTLATSTSLSISLYMQFNFITPTSYSHTVNIIAYSSAGSIIIDADTSSLVFTISQWGSPALALSGTMNSQYAAGSAYPLYITFALTSNTLVNGDYLQIDFGNWVIDPATLGSPVFKYQIAGNIYWVPSQASLVSGNIWKVPVYLNYSMTSGNEITLLVDSFCPTTYSGARVPSIQWNDFKIYAYRSTNVLVEQQIKRIWTEPFNHPSFVPTPALRYASAIGLWQFSVTPNVSATAGDSILIEFLTADGIQTTLFSNNLGRSIPAGNSGFFDCAQLYSTHIISNDIIKCRIYAGDSTANPPIPTTIVIPITKNIAANTAINFNINDIQNPSLANYPMSVVFKLANKCNSQDSVNLCSYYKSVYYMTFNPYSAPPGVGSTGTLSFNPSRVSATNTLHTISASYSLAIGDFIKLIYYTQIAIPTECVMSSSNGQCYSYPMTNTIIVKITTASSSPFSIVLANMNNPYQNYYGTATFNVQIWKGGVVNSRFYSSYSATTISTDPTTSTALSISFTPTLTPNYWLKYNFNNIGKVVLSKFFQNAFVKQIRLTAPGQITLDTQYCNATFQSSVTQAKPYPYRFVCQVLNSQTVQLNLFSDFPTFAADFTQRTILIYLRYTINTGQMVASNTWSAYAYSDPSSTSSWYQISYGTGNFLIVEYQTPFLYVINFPTRSFDQRTCTIGQQCMVYGFLFPTTLTSEFNINRMTFVLPRQFNYSSQQTFDSCFIQSKTTVYEQFSCTLGRNNSRITIAFNPSSYNQQYNLFNIDHSTASLLFKAPSYPGNHYQMLVNLWTTSNLLAQSQLVNLTTVYGYYLSVPLIKFVIPLDASQKGLFDLTFTVGTADILPSYINSADYTITSGIEITFSNSFAADLGTGLAAGSEIACLNITGLTFNIMGKITCRIYPSVSTITYPTIIVTGYDRIYASTVVRIRFADLKTLAAGFSDYCKLGVSYSYYDYGGAKGYIYEPVSFVVGPTSAPNTAKTITYTISEISSNYVGQLSDYTLSGSIANGFSPITTTDYFVVQFPKYSFEGRFNLNAQALCSLATSSFCNVFGLANQIYIQPASTVTAAAFSFTITKLLNAAYQLEYITQNITLFTLISNKVDALGYATFTKFTQASLNVSSIITSIDSIYGGDSGINYYFSFQLNSYLPETGKISIFFPSIYISLFTVNSKCYLRMDSQALAGTQAYCQIINTYQLVIVPNGVLFSTSQPYYVTVTNITNPNLDLSSYKFKIETYYFSDVYQAKVISRNYFQPPTFSLITVKKCQLQITASIYNENLPSQYQINLICPATIKQSSELKLYLSWNPTQTNLTCQSDANILYSTQCNIMTEFDQNVKKTYLSIYLRSIQAQKLISIVATVTNGNQGTYIIDSTINYNGFVYLTAKSNSYYVISTSTSTSSGSLNTGSTSTSNSLSVRTRNYPLNRYVSSIYTFALTNPKQIVSTLQIDVPTVITQSKTGITCGYLTWKDDDDYFNLMVNKEKNALTCNMTGQKIVISDLTQILTQMGQSTNSNQFLYIIIGGIVNPATSVSLSNFTFTFINTTSSIPQAAGIFPLALSYTISDAPLNLQISNIALSDSRYYVSTLYTFTVTSVQSVNIVLVKSTLLGLMIHFPTEYSQIWGQIAPPTTVDLTISGTVYSATNITMIDRYLFARFTQNTFGSQLTFTSFTVAFNFRNPNKSIDCTVTPVFEFSLFDFKGNSVFAQTLSNNQICPTLRDRLFSVNVTGNTKISAGSSNAFIVSIEKPSEYLAVTPSCTSSAISFSPSVVTFKDFKSTQATFNISAAVGLSGYFNITFTKTEGAIKFYNDIQFITINVYIPVQSYTIKMAPFSVKSIGYPIKTTFTLEVPSPTDFAITYKTTCNDNYAFIPADRISIPAQTTEVALYIQYKGSTIPEMCEISFAIYALTTNNFQLETIIAYLSGKPSIDKSANIPPLILELTTFAQKSTSVGQTIISKADEQSTSSKNYYNAQKPTVYQLEVKSAGSNKAELLATTSTEGTIYYAVLISGTPTDDISQSQIYNKSMDKAILYGNSKAALNTSGVNIISQFTILSLVAQTKYIVAAYVNTTIGNSPIIFKNISTSKASNGAAIKLGMNNKIVINTLLQALSNVWRIKIDRLAVITSQDTQDELQSTFTSQVMNSRTYVYEVVIAPDTEDDSKKPIELLSDFIASTNDKYRLSTFIPEYIVSYTSSIREIMPIKPKIRLNPLITRLSHNKIQLEVYTWETANVSGIAVPIPASKPYSSQISNALDSKNNPVPSQHFSNVISIESGVALLTFTQLTENTTYAIYITAACVIPFKPALLLSDSEVVSIQAHTEVDLNLMKNQNLAVEIIKKSKPELAAEVEKHMNRMKNSEQIQGVDKTKKRRD